MGRRRVFLKGGKSVHGVRELEQEKQEGERLKADAASKVKNALRTLVVAVVVSLFLGFFLLNV